MGKNRSHVPISLALTICCVIAHIQSMHVSKRFKLADSRTYLQFIKGSFSSATAERGHCRVRIIISTRNGNLNKCCGQEARSLPLILSSRGQSLKRNNPTDRRFATAFAEASNIPGPVHEQGRGMRGKGTAIEEF